jgi:hypothetical protein
MADRIEPFVISVAEVALEDPSRRWAQRRFANIVHWNQPAHGGHFAAWEQPSLFTGEVRAVARSCGARPGRGPGS